MGRIKGFTVSEETKQKQKETRIKNKHNLKKKKEYEKQILPVTGKEQSGFDYWPAMRNVLRPIHQYVLCKKIEQEVAGTIVWNDIKAVKEILEKYFILEIHAKNLKKPIIIKSEEKSKRMKETMRKYWANKKASK